MSDRPVTSTLPSSRSDPARPCGLENAFVCVLAGGRSSEREVSLASGRMIRAALASPEDPVDRRGPARVLTVEILPSGRWRVGRHELTPGAAIEALVDVDVFFFALHGGDGEDGTLQGLLAAADRAFTGTGVAGSAVGMDKVFSREILAARGLLVAPATTVRRARWDADPEGVRRELETWEVPGWAVKPRCGGSSVGCTLVREPDEWSAAFAAAFAWEDEVLVEALVEGVEVTGGVLATPDEGLEALPVVEIRPHPGRFFDYEEKYAADGAEEICPPTSVSPETCRRVRELSRRAHRALRCAGYSRSDFIVPRDGGEPVFLELNTLPGMTPRSLVPLAAAQADIDYRTLCLWIAADALRRG